MCASIALPARTTAAAPIAGAKSCSQWALLCTHPSIAESVTAISPATHPSTPPPTVTMIGQRFMSFSTSVLP